MDLLRAVITLFGRDRAGFQNHRVHLRRRAVIIFDSVVPDLHGQGVMGAMLARTVTALKDAGYDGALTNEFVAPVDRTPAAKYPDMVERNPVDIPPEQLKFIQDHGSSVLTEKFYADQMRITAETILPLIK